jgi:hypothetical protein
MATPSVPLKQCSRKDKCCNPLGSWLPATTDYFRVNPKGKMGLHPSCKECEKARNRDYMYKVRADPSQRERLLEISRKADKKRANDPKRKADNRARWERRKLDPEYKQAERERSRQRYRESEVYRDYHREYNREYRKGEKYKTRVRAYKRTDKYRAYRREYNSRAEVREYYRLHSLRRRSKRNELDFDFSAEDKRRALQYFNGCCAVCGRQLNDLFGEHTGAMDHWVALSKDGPTIASNLIPLCHGVDGCNNSKHDYEPQEWLEKKFGKRKAKRILKRIQDYFDSLT